VENVRWSKLCIKDSLEIFQFTEDGSREKKGRYCGKQTGKQFTVYGSKMEFRFRTNGYRTKRGFRIEWEAIKGLFGHAVTFYSFLKIYHLNMLYRTHLTFHGLTHHIKLRNFFKITSQQRIHIPRKAYSWIM